MKGLRTIGIAANSALLVAAVGYSASAAAAPLILSNAPLFLGGNVEPNLVFNLDDSGSMQFEYMPGEGFHPDYSYFLFPRPSSPYGAGTYTNFVPNFFDNNLHNFFMRSAHNNAIFYNPNITYKPWVNADGSDMANANPAAAYYNPRLPDRGTINLTAARTQTAYWFGNFSGSNVNYAQGQWTAANQYDDWDANNNGNPDTTGSHTYVPITYYNYNSGPVTARASYTLVQITSATSSTATFAYTDPADGLPKTRTRDEEIQNFANWFQYHRSRILTARAGIGRAFGEQGPGMRVAFAAINKGSADIDGVTSPGALRRGVRPFSGSARTNFFNDLYDEIIDSDGTPLRRAMDDVGKYFERPDNRGPWGNTPGTDDGSASSAHLECRQSYQILMTDGYWNGDDAPTSGARNNVDNTAGTTITNSPLEPLISYTYTPAAPFKDSYGHPNPDGGTLADIAMYYWNRDLRANVVNDVITNPQDPAFWQHLVTFTVGLGVSGTLDPATDLPGLTSGALQWPNPEPSAAGSQNPEKTDDLWHTALNGHGQFFSAADPATFANALSDALSAIKDRNGSAASVALNSGSITSNARLYQARFDSGDWSGQLVAYALHDGVNHTYGCTDQDPIGKVCPTIVWDAGEVIDTQDWNTGRKIVTYKPSNDEGIPFRWPANPSSPTASELDSTQIAALNDNPATGSLDNDSKGQNRLEYLRGRIVTAFRNRSSVLGDIVHSAPAYVGAPAFNYPNNWGSGAPENASPYAAFRTTSANQNRDPMLYVGANDGMLHAFTASSGQERFAYVPSAVYPDLSKLTSRSYSHRYYVDGSPTAVDAYVNGQWRTILASGLRGGGRGTYALDVTTPPSSSESETTAASRVLWEYNHADSGGADLGYTFGEVNIVRMKNGTWAAVFGNGYNSDNGRAVLYIVDLDDGSLIKKIDTLAGSAATPNGLAAPAPVDINGDFIVDYIYAGDLLGNLWKFDVTSSSTASWGVAYSGTPLFQARTGGGAVQPITVRPQVGLHPTGLPKKKGVMLYFGTGKYIESTDNTPTGQNTQTFYGVWDKQTPTIPDERTAPEVVAGTFSPFIRSHLLEQKITDEETVNGFKVRVTSANPITWHTTSGTPTGSPPSSHLGWYLDLVNTEGGNTNNFGERQVTNPVLRNGRIIFTTLVPTELVNACDFGGDGWLMELDASGGSRLAFSPFDLDGDGKFDEDDYAIIYVDGQPVKVPVSGKKSTVGIIPTPSVVAGSEPTEYKFTSGSTGMIETTRENAGAEDLGRQTWRQLR